MRITPSAATPTLNDNFSVDVAVDLSATTGFAQSGTSPAALSAFRLPITFDKTRLQLTSIAAGTNPLFVAAGFDATDVASANAAGRLTITAVASGPTAPSGIVSVATLNFSAKSGGAATIAADVSTLSLASAIQVSGATLFGPAAIPGQSVGGGVVVQLPPSIAVTLEAGPSPVSAGGQLIYDLHVTNNGGATAHGIVLSVPIPSGTTVSATSAGGTTAGGVVQWNAGNLPAAAAYEAFVSLNVTTPAGTAINGAPATATATDTPSTTSSAVAVGVTAASPALKPGTILAAASNERGNEVIYDVTTGTPVFFAKVPSGGWIGALLITATGRLYVATDAYGGSIFDATAGGDLTNATPLVRGIVTQMDSLVRDAAGNFYTTALADTKIFKIAPSGQVTTLDPSFVTPSGLLVVGNLLYVAEAGTGSVKTVDLTTGAVSTFATGFPTDFNLFSGQLIRNSQGHIYLLWGHRGTNLGLFDITAGGNFSTAVPVTAKNAFRTDDNQMAVDASDNIYFAGNGSENVWRSTFSGGAYGATTVFASGVSDSEAMAIYPRPPVAQLTLSTSASATQAVNTFPLTYTLKYANNGGASSANVVLTATLPSGVSFVSATGGGTSSGNQVTWSLGTLAVNATGTQSVTVNVVAAASTILAATTCTLTAGDGTTTSATLPSLAVLAAPHLTVSVTPSATSVPTGSYLTYTIGIVNDGGTAATNVVVTDSIPDIGTRAAFVAASDNGALAGTTVTWHIASLAAGASITETLVVRATGAAGTSINNNGGSISADNLAASTGAASVTSITSASTLTLTLTAGPSPVVPRTQVNALAQYANTGATTLNNVTIVAAIPADADVLSETGSPVVANRTVTWTVPTLAAGATGTFRYSIRVNAPAGAREVLTATISSTEQPLAAGAPATVSVSALPDFYVPGCTFVADSFFDNGFEARPIYRLTSNPITMQLFASPPRTQWVGPLHVPANGHLYTAIQGTDTKPGVVYDITAGGDLSAATPFAKNAGNYPQSMVSDEAGNLYISSGNTGDPPTTIRKVTPEGDTIELPPLFQDASGLFYDSGFLYVAEGGTGTVWKMNLQTFDKTAFVTGFPKGPSPSGEMIRNQQGHLYMLWGDPANRTPSGNLGLFDITNGGDRSTMTPVSAAGAFRIDVNQMALFPDNSILIASNGSLRLWRVPFANGQYGTTTQYFTVNIDNESVAIVPPLRLTIGAVAAPAHIFSGDSVTFTITYANNSLTAVKNAFVTATLPSGTAFSSATAGGTLAASTITWHVGTIAAGGSGSVSFTATVNALEGSTLTLQTYSVGGDDALTASGAPVSITVEQPLQVAATALPTSVTIGQSITFTLAYENRNAAAASGVVVRAAIPNGTTFLSASTGGSFASGAVTWSVGSVAAGATGNVSFTVRADSLPSATLADDSVSSNEFGSRAGLPLSVPVLPLPFDLSVAAAAAPSPVTSGTNLTYTFSYANSGGSTAPSVVLQDPIPAGTTFVAASGGSLVGNAAVWQLGAIPSGVSGTVVLTVAVNAQGGTSVTNANYTIGNSTQLRTGAAIVTPVVAPPPPAPLAVMLSASPQPVTSGDLLTYQIVVNNPTSVAATNVVVSDAIPSGTSMISATGPASTASDTVQWSLGTLAPNDSVSLALTVRVTAPAGSSIVNAGATATCSGRNPGTSSGVTTSVIAPPATLEFTVVAPASVTSGDAITYTLSYANDGPAPVSGAIITDPIPSGATFLSASDSGTVTNGLATWTLGTLAPGASGSVSFVVTATAPAGSTIVNSGSTIQASGAPSVQGPTVNTDVVAPPIVVAGALTTDKSSYAVPDIVHQSASFTYLSGGTGLLTALTAKLSTSNVAGTEVASTSQAIDSIAAGATVPVAYDWNTTGASTGNYTVTFTVTDSAGNVLVRRSLAVSVAAPDGARLTGTIAPTNSPVPLGIALQAQLTVQNQNSIAYAALPLEVDLLDPATLAIRKAVTLAIPVNANASAVADVSIPTTGLATGDYALWLTTSAGAGRLLATSSATIIAPTLALSPPSLTLVAGSSGTLTATLGTALPNAATLAVTSSALSIVSVPGSVTIPAGQTSVAVPVQAVGIGGATITATLGAASASSQVTVIMSGSLTATLQVTQGETETFGVTITNNGQTNLTNASFAVEIRNPSGGGLVDVVPFTASVAAGSSYTTSLSYVTSTLAAQKYDARLVFTGIDPHVTLATAQFTVLVAAPLRLTAAVGGPARVLIWSNCSPGNSGTPCTPAAPPFLTANLRNAGIPYVVVGDENAFLAKMRTGGFTCAVIDQAGAAEPTIAPEYLADVHAGFGLLFIHSAPNAMPKLAPALATKFLGTFAGPTTMTLLSTPFTTPGTLTLNGSGVTIRLDGARAAATLPGGDPAISYAAYGKGNVVVVPFDLEQTQTSAVAALILSSVNWISRPVSATADARAVVPLQFAVTTPPGGQVPITVTVTLPSSVGVVDALPALTTTSPVSWSALAAGNTTTTFDLWIRLPNVAGTVTITIDAGTGGGPPVVTKTIDLTVATDANGLASTLSNDLSVLRSAALTNSDHKAIDDAIAQLAVVTATADPLANAQRVLAIIGDLQTISLNTNTARADADRLLVYWQSRIGA